MAKYIPILFIVLAGCGKVVTEGKYKIIGSGEYISLNTTGLINPKTNYLSYYEENDNCWLFYGNVQRSELIIYKLPSGEIEKRITFDSRGPEGIGGYRGVFVHNLDSLFITSARYVHNFFLADTSGKVKKRYSLEADDIRGITPSLMYQYSHLNNQNIIKNNTINLRLSPVRHVENEDLHEEIISIEYCLENEQIVRKFNYPVFDNLKVNNSTSSRTYNGEQFIYSFRRSDIIYVKNDDGTYIEYDGKSRYRDKSLDWEIKRHPSIFLVRKNSLSNPRYLSVLYDEYQKFIYRSFLPGYEIDDTKENAEIEKYFDFPKKFTIMIFDEDFNVVGETLLPEKTYDPYMKFVSKDGLYMALHFDHPLYNPDSLKFERMIVVEN